MVNIAPSSSTIDILMATYNGGKYLSEQFDSIVNQTHKDWKLIIHDDGSSDNTVYIIKQYMLRYPEKIILIDNDVYTGEAKNNFAYLMQFSSSQYITLCDQDDVWFPHKLEMMISLLQKYDLVMSDVIIVDEVKNLLNESFYKLNHSKRGFLNNLVHNSYIGCAMAFNRKIYESAMPIPKNIPMHDWWIGLVAEIFGSVIFTDDKLMYYRRHNTNASQTSEKSKYSIFKKISFRGIIVSYIILRWIRQFIAR
ncbi:glycosyltransferase family 2 protein [Sulfurospirillum sp. 'SP']|nr:glycosyltransferase family 2 protein [Sulfurospirillum sp. 'SP']WNY99519.1 glycosyltransferase family 2 protein [Sulfurospirillum sp. 'SP']